MKPLKQCLFLTLPLTLLFSLAAPAFAQQAACPDNTLFPQPAEKAKLAKGEKALQERMKAMTVCGFYPENMNQWDVSGVSDMKHLFSMDKFFNQPIGQWDVSRVSNMERMFNDAQSFNQPIGNWDVSQVTDMRGMFAGAQSFNQDISGWCVSQIPQKPEDFDTGASAWEERFKPKWGTCPGKRGK